MTKKENLSSRSRRASRRDFLRTSSFSLAAVGLARRLDANPNSTAMVKEGKKSSTQLVIDKEAMKIKGDWYEAIVPDTLDLAKQAEFSLNVLTHNVEPANYYSVYQGFKLGKPEVPARKPELLLWNGTAKNARTLPWIRTMCGSDKYLDVEYEMMRVLTDAIDKDGQVRYFPVDQNDKPVPGGLSNHLINALVLLGMANWYERDKNPAWLDRIRLVSDGLQQMAIQIEDRAYYPLECGYGSGDTWRAIRFGHLLPYTPPEEPMFDQQGAEGAVKIQNARQIAGLVKHFRFSGDQTALEMARKIARFCLKPTLWVDTRDDGYLGNEHAVWEGHFHGTVYTLHMLMELALVDNNDWLKRFIREGYHHSQRFGAASMGWFPAWTYPSPDSLWRAGRKPEAHNNRTEGCAVSDMLMLAVKLSDSGLGDYWDDVDHIVRNQLVEQQFTNLDLMRQCAGGGHEHDALLSRFLGGFGAARTTCNLPQMAGCCTANCAVGLYYAWHGITRFDEGVATVNLFLNRASGWLDVDSYLPYEGKVLLHNKMAHTALVRMPGWLKTRNVKSTVNNKAAQPRQAGAYLVFQNLKKGDQIRLEFEVPESVQEYTIAGLKHRLFFRGSTLVDINPRMEVPGSYPTYQREHMRAAKARMKTMNRFVPHMILPLQ